MPKKRKDEDDDNVVPMHVPDKVQWTCKKCNPPATIKAASKRDMKVAQIFHMLQNH